MLRKITQIGKNKYKNWTQINFLLKIPPKNQQFKEISKSAYQKYCWIQLKSWCPRWLYLRGYGLNRLYQYVSPNFNPVQRIWAVWGYILRNTALFWSTLAIFGHFWYPHVALSGGLNGSNIPPWMCSVMFNQFWGLVQLIWGHCGNQNKI